MFYHKYQISHSKSLLIPHSTFLIVFLSLMFCLHSQKLLAQNIDQKPLNLQVDFARYRISENTSLLEIYYAFDRNAIDHNLTAKGFHAKYDVNLKIFYQDSLISELHWPGSDLVGNMSDIKQGQMISDVHQIVLGSGNFNINITVTDLHSKNQEILQLDVQCPDWFENKLQLSDIQLGICINKMDAKSRFTKNGYHVQPNPGITFNTAWPVLFYYFEIYNLNSLKDKGIFRFKIKSEIRDKDAKTVKEIPEKIRSVDNYSDIIEIGKALVVSLPSGQYDLNVTLLDENDMALVNKNKLFYVYRAADQAVAKADNSEKMQDELRRLYLSKSEQELDQEFNHIFYIISSNEEDIYGELNLVGKREFFVNFWESKALREGKNKLHIRQEYLDRIDYANSNYSSSGTDGWETDKGRTVIKYGVPDDIERFYGSTSQKDHEIWTYDAIQGGVKFVFLDITGYGIFRLVHSTAHDEIQDYEWQTRYLQ